ncbi:nucleotide-binding universal stress UspA family protein [Streptomyces sp. SAI-208]|uniref:universal stress protein n=1 Tax=Streptomyces sp. SAI-208 TaxID=2940550 RepID=UPI0024730CF3|nr:universal stress protein [Streptomyces sp. SAI-208]MDH6605086.1 nucleotide-binding universal stress UspA family protein [Streptomyces sp. SAI-208]
MSEFRPPAAARVVVGVSGSLGSLSALARAAEEARQRGAELWPVLAWEPPGGEFAVRRSPATALMVGQWEQLARERLLTALREVFGGTDLGVPLRAVIARGAAGPALVQTAGREDDLLMLGAGRRGLRRALRPSVSRYCLAHATCPVLAVPPSPLQSDLAAVHRRNVWRLRLDSGHLEQEFETVPPDA